MAKMAKADNSEFSMQWPKADDGKRVHHLIKITIDFSSAFAHLHLFKHALLLHDVRGFTRPTPADVQGDAQLTIVGLSFSGSANDTHFQPLYALYICLTKTMALISYWTR